jgi:hypothetical protein
MPTLLMLVIGGAAQLPGSPGLRVMPIDELSKRADAIVRCHVKKIEKANYLGTYTQLATLDVKDIVKGDNRLKEIKVWAGSNVINANDFFNKDNEVLLFLVREKTYFHTLNYQYGQFLIEGEFVKNWRDIPELPPPPIEPPGVDGGSATTEKSYFEARKEIEAAMRINKPLESPPKK